MEKRRVLVSGATGQQGGSVVQALLKDGHQVMGITRNTESPKAKNLTAQGVKMVSADFTETEKLTELMNKADTVFSVTTPFERGLDYEIEQGKTMSAAAQKAGVGHFIFNSVGDADQATGVPHFDSKYEVEKYLKTLNMPYTIIGPSSFMDNMFLPYIKEPLKEGVLKIAMPGNRKLQHIAVSDIGKFVGIVVNERDNMFGKRINISGDEITGDEAAEVLTRVLGKEIRYEGYSPDYLREQSEDLAIMFEWFINTGYTANMEELKKYNFLSFEEWALKQDWNSL